MRTGTRDTTKPNATMTGRDVSSISRQHQSQDGQDTGGFDEARQEEGAAAAGPETGRIRRLAQEGFWPRPRALHGLLGSLQGRRLGRSPPEEVVIAPEEDRAVFPRVGLLNP